MTFKRAFARIIRLISLCSECYDCNVQTARTWFQWLGRFQIWDRLKVSSLFLLASKFSQYGGPAQNDMISMFEWSRLDTIRMFPDPECAQKEPFYPLRLACAWTRAQRPCPANASFSPQASQALCAVLEQWCRQLLPTAGLHRAVMAMWQSLTLDCRGTPIACFRILQVYFAADLLLSCNQHYHVRLSWWLLM